MPTAPTQAPLEAPLDTRRVRLVFTGLSVAILLASLDQTILSTALPTIVAELDGVAAMSWAITSYVLAATVVMPLYGRLGDLSGRKPLFLAAIALFMIGSVIAGSAGSMTGLIMGRFVQGLGGGGMIITAQALVADVVPPRQRAAYLGLLGGIFAVSSVAGPLLGGFFTDVVGWRWAFWINLPIGAAALLVSALTLPRPPEPRRRARVDAAGMALLAVGVTSLVLLSGWAGSTYAWTSRPIIGLALLTVVCTLAFVAVERRAAEPVMPLTLFRDRAFLAATGAGLLLAVAMFAAISYLPTFLQKVGGHGATEAGLMLVAMMAGVLVASALSGQLISATGHYRGYPVVGMVLTGTALLLMSTMDAGTGTTLVMAYLALLGVGLGLAMQVLVLVVQNAADHALVGTATAANNFFREIGASLGTAVVGSIFTARLAERLATQPEPVAYADALTPVLGWLSLLCVAGLVLVLLIPRIPLRTTNHTPTPTEETRP